MLRVVFVFLFRIELPCRNMKWRTVSRGRSWRGGAGMSQGWKITVIVLAVAGVVSTPLVWLLDGPDAGQLTGACVQAAAGIAALVWALFQHSGSRADDTAVRTGRPVRTMVEQR